VPRWLRPAPAELVAAESVVADLVAADLAAAGDLAAELAGGLEWVREWEWESDCRVRTDSRLEKLGRFRSLPAAEP